MVGKGTNNEEKKYEKGHGDRMCLLCGFPKTRLSTETFSASTNVHGPGLVRKAQNLYGQINGTNER